MTTQPSLFSSSISRDKVNLANQRFSHDRFSNETAREALERKFKGLLQETDDFDRRSVSFQGNRKALVHSWIKYKEGFSASLVEKLIDEFGLKPGDSILEPFSGSATTLLVAKSRGINAVGFEILPNCQLIWEAKKRIFSYSLDELRWVRQMVLSTEMDKGNYRFPHIEITNGAFPAKTEKEIIFFSKFLDELVISDEAKILVKLVITSILEEISYTRKDGQYLRWDYRSSKVSNRSKTNGNKPIHTLDKGKLLGFKEAFISRLDDICRDIEKLQDDKYKRSNQKLISKSVLYALPELKDNSFDAVITSPPYCNRYDYTRSYALELAYLGVADAQIKQLRQELLSCTVENKTKIDKISAYYESIGAKFRFSKILDVIENDPALREVEAALVGRWENGDINNRGVLRMVKGYFIDLGFVIAEMYRTCKKGANVAVVNDNVRYGGEIIPVDLISTNLAKAFGFQPVSVYVLPQKKGNSSQQMKKFGRQPLRKSIAIWRK